jgi:hypothetical protein
MNEEVESSTWCPIPTHSVVSVELLSRVILTCAQFCRLRLTDTDADRPSLEVLCTNLAEFREIEPRVHQAVADQVLRERIRERSTTTEGEMLLAILSKQRGG